MGGLAGFGIGRATGGDDGPRFARTGQFGPGQQGIGRPGQQGRGGFGGGQRNGAPGSGQGGTPEGQQGGQPPAPDNSGSGSDGT